MMMMLIMTKVVSIFDWKQSKLIVGHVFVMTFDDDDDDDRIMNTLSWASSSSSSMNICPSNRWRAIQSHLNAFSMNLIIR